MRLLADRYELTASLGRGTMGTVWRAWDRSLGRAVAIKEIRQDPRLTAEQRAELRERLIREGRIAARLNHPSVAMVHDAIVAEGSPWIIMELVEGRSLERVIEEEGPLPPRLVAEIGLDLLSALRAAHDQGILHRDVKPGNVLLTDSGRVVLTDFGIAKAADDEDLTRTGMVIGSPGYTAPERARGDYAGPESDLWSLGATLYFAAEGRPAFERGSLAATLSALMTQDPYPPTQAGPLGPVLEGLLRKDYTKRLDAITTANLLRGVVKGAPDTPVRHRAAGGGGADQAPDHVPDESDQTVMVARPRSNLRMPGTPLGRPGPSSSPGEAAGPSAPATRPGTPVAPASAVRASGAEAPHGEMTRGEAPDRQRSGSGHPGQGYAGWPERGDRGPRPPGNPEYHGPSPGSRPPGGSGPAPSPGFGPARQGPAGPRPDTTGSTPPYGSAYSSEFGPAPQGPAGARPSGMTGPTSPPGSRPPGQTGPVRSRGSASEFGPTARGPAGSRPPGMSGPARSPGGASELGSVSQRHSGAMPAGPAPTGGPVFSGPGPGHPEGPAGARYPGADPGSGPGPSRRAELGRPHAEGGNSGGDARMPPGDDDDLMPGLGTEIFQISGPPRPPQSRVESRTGMILLVGVAIAGLVAIIILVASAVSSSGEAAPAGAVSSLSAEEITVSPTAGRKGTPTSPPSVAATADATGQVTPAGLRRFAGEGNYTIDVPAVSKTSVNGSEAVFTGAGGATSIRIAPLAATSDLLGMLTEQEKKVSASTPDYRRIRLGVTKPAPYPGTDVADWEYTCTRGSRSVHVMSRWILVPGGASYVIDWTGSQATWQAQAAQRNAVLASFKPARGDVAGGS